MPRRELYENGALVAVEYTLPLEDEKAAKILSIKDEAARRIYALFPGLTKDQADAKKENVIARGVELSDIRHDRLLTAEEEAERQAIQTLWAQVKAIRAASNAAEAEVMAAETNEAVDAVEW